MSWIRADMHSPAAKSRRLPKLCRNPTLCSLPRASFLLLRVTNSFFTALRYFFSFCFCQSLFLLCFCSVILAVSSHFVVSWNPEKRALFTPKPRGLPNHTPPFTHTSCANMGVTSILFPATSSFFSILPPSTLFSAGLTNTHTHTLIYRLLLVLRRKQQLKSDHSSSLCYKFPFSCLIQPRFTEKLLKYYSPCPFHTIFSFMFILLNRHQQ